MASLFELKKFKDSTALVNALSADTQACLNQAISDTGNASWAVSGGSTPKLLFRVIRNADLDWGKIDVALVDDRWVPESHDRSNEAFVKTELLTNKAAAASFTGMYTGHDNPLDGEAEVEARYDKLKLPFDCIHIGLGPDGHTASLFPGADGLDRAFDPNSERETTSIIAKQSDVTGSEVKRMTLTAAAIARSNNIYLMITGDAKLETFKAAFKSDIKLPIVRLCEMLNTPLQVYWAP